MRKKNAFTGLSKLTIVAPSVWMKSIVGKSFLAEYPICVIGNGVDTSTFRPLDKGNVFQDKYEIEDKFIILGVAYQWTESKGFNEFLRLAKVLPSEFKVVLIGVSEVQLQSLPKEVLGIPKVGNALELANLYSAADVFVNLTLDDNLPTVNLEAIACGTPVITYDTGGCAETIDSGSGIVVPAGNFDRLLDAISLVRQLGKRYFSINCRKRACEIFSEDIMTTAYTELYLSFSGDKLNRIC